jgi:hypothetical protein
MYKAKTGASPQLLTDSIAAEEGLGLARERRRSSQLL